MTRNRAIVLKRLGLAVLAVAALAFGCATWEVVRAPLNPALPPLVVSDVSQLNPIQVSEVLTPTTTQEVVNAVASHAGPISIGGARHSMGGQIATAGALHLDMRGFDHVVAFSPRDKTIRVQAGARWRQVQEYIDPSDLSVAIMQTYANFTVGGSLSVNVHGRYVGRGPLIKSVRSLEVVLADGSVVEASPDLHPEIFNGVIGGYGGLGVITEATLGLEDNVKVKRQDRTMPVGDYKAYFVDQVLGSSSAVFHNGDLYPNAYDTIHAVTFARTEDPLTVTERLQPLDQSYRLDRFLFWVASEWPLGKAARQYLFDPIVFRDEPVTLRNYEASYDASALEPASRADSTYVLQEYFVPTDRFDDFVPLMRDVLQRHNVNVINVSVRHAGRDAESLLSWARTDVFAFVIYYKQETSPAAQEAVGVWTRELIDAALSTGGSYYLPYQVLATEEQFHQAYPRADEYFALKRRLDPDGKFRNELLNRYNHPDGR